MASVKVAVRVRPLNKREKDMASAFIVHMEAQKTFITNVKLPLGMEVSHTLGRERVKQFCYDYSYWSADKHDENYASQQRVYEDLGDDVVKSAYEGYNACVFAYGQTGSGKTYTMMGEDEDEGIIPRICQSLFSQMQDGDTTYRTEVSYLEIYNERVRDLLREKPKDGKQPNLRVREHPKDGPYVQDLSKHIVVNYLEIEELMEKGNINRTTAATNMNDVSSRSHAIFTIVFTQAKFQDDIPSEIHSKIHLVDLAGSERVDASGATGQRLKEGGSINKSLVTLGKIISTLADVTDKIPSAKKNVFIPYRDSVLTWLLKDSLGGNAKTIMIATISPADCNYAETLSTLRYASRAKRIINKPTVNEDPNVKLIRELREENARLRALLSGQNIPNFQQNVAAQEKLERNEEKVKQLTEKWTGKWQETAAILQEHKTLALRKEGIGVVLDSELPYLLALDDDILSTGMKLYHLKEGETTVGREDATVPQDIALSGQYIEAEHCIFQNFNCSVILVPLGGALCCVNNSRIHETTKISQGAIIRLGRHHLFRFNHPWEAARLREELRESQASGRLISSASFPGLQSHVAAKSGQIAMLKVSHDFQWTWSSPSIPDSALGSELEIEQKPPEELEKLEEKRRQLEALEEEHLFAEATRLATLVEQEGIKEDLLEKEEELHILKFETDIVKSEAEKVQKEIKRLSSHFEEQVQEHLQESHKLLAEQERVASEKARVEEEKRSAQEERAKLTEERKKESTWMSVEKERQLEEWAELNQEKRRLAIAKEREEKQRVTKEPEVEYTDIVELTELADVIPSEVEAAREVEKEIYSQAMVEMRTLIQEEVKQLKRLSGLDNITPTELSSSQSATTLQTNSQSGTVIENTMNGHADLHQSDEIELQIKELQLNLAQSEGRDEVNMSQSESSEVSSLNHSDYRDRTAQSVHSDLSEREEFRGDGSRGSVSHDLSLLDHSESAIDRIVSYLMEEHAQAMARSGDESMMGSMCESIHSTEDGPVLPTKYLTGSPMAQRPTELLLTCGLDDSIISQSSEASVPPSMDDVAAMLAQLEGHVSGIHSKVCESLRRKYTSMLSSDDTTQGLGNEVIHQFTQIRPLFDELEKVAHQFPLPADVKDLPERLEHFDRTLTTVDQFLRIHEAVQAIVGGIKTKRFLEIVENLEIVQKLMADVDVCGDLESSVYRVLQTEVCIQREQLLFQLGETWNELLKWTLPNDSRRNANQPRTATLEIPEEEESKGILEQCAQAMLKVNMLQARIKTLCDRLMTYFVEATVLDSNSLVQMVIDTRKSVLCVVQYPKSQQGTQVVPAAQLFPKLEQVFIFLHRRFVDVLIEENIDIKGQKVKAIKDHKPEKRTVPLIRKIGHLMTRQLFEYIFNECLCHSIPKDNSKWDKFNEVVTLTEKFQDLLVALNFVPKDQSNLLDYFNNVNSLFANMKGQEILKRAHQMMTHDLQVSVEVSTEHPLGEPEADKPPATVMSPTLQLFVKTCREEVGASSQRIPTCQISISVQGLVCLTYDTVREALMGSAECATHLSYTVHNVFELFCDVLPSYHKDKLTTLPLLAALHHNNCMFVAHHVMTMDKKLRIKICPDPTTPTKYAMLCDLVPKVRKLGNDNFTHHIVMKKQELCSCLMPADGFECIADDEGRMASEALAEVARRLHDISSTWRQVLPIKVYCKAMGTLLNAVVMDIVDSVLLIGEFSADDCEVLQSTLSAMTSSSVGLFTLQQTRSNPLVLLHEYVPNWMKFNELLLILGSRLQDVSDRWADGKGPLALHFSAEEVRKLVIAMFENTSKRDALLAQLR